jgi:biofilm PGA synthesis N-glycosyltransferase PgaC
MLISAAVPVHNEEANIGLLIDTLRDQRLVSGTLVEIVVVASGCSDRTAEIVRERQLRAGVPVRLIEEAQRSGKVAAINTYLQHQTQAVDALLLCSGDLLVAPDALERLARCLHDSPAIGMCGARPMPTNARGTFLGEATNFLWNMHHRVALESPKLGEMVMLRAGIVDSLPPESIVDEANLEQLIRAAGYELAYVPEAIVRNHGPETPREFLRQRRRIAAGHYWLADASGYRVATMNLPRVARLALAELAEMQPEAVICAVGAIALECVARALGFIDFKIDLKKHIVWKVSQTTKSVANEEIRALYNLTDDSSSIGSSRSRDARPAAAA